ncbi:hypothetical protein ACFL1B_01000 [Nanoarchaeota archaeon]
MQYGNRPHKSYEITNRAQDLDLEKFQEVRDILRESGMLIAHYRETDVEQSNIGLTKAVTWKYYFQQGIVEIDSNKWVHRGLERFLKLAHETEDGLNRMIETLGLPVD